MGGSDSLCEVLRETCSAFLSFQNVYKVLSQKIFPVMSFKALQNGQDKIQQYNNHCITKSYEARKLWWNVAALNLVLVQSRATKAAFIT